MRRTGRGFKMLAAGAMLGLGLVGCATGPSPSELLDNRRLLNRAAFDLECAGALNVTPLDRKTRSVGGCGRQATYVQLCDAPGDDVSRSCVWVNNGTRGGRLQ